MKRVTILVAAVVCTCFAAGDAFAGSDGRVPDNHTLYLKAGLVDTSAGAGAEAARVAVDASSGTRRVIQLDGPITHKRRAALEEAGIRLGDYLPAHAYIVELSPDQLEAVAELTFVQWVGSYRDQWRIDPDLAHQAAATDRDLDVTIALFPGEDAEAVVADLAALGGEVNNITTIGDRSYIDSVLPPGQLVRISRWSAVQFAAQAPQGELRNDTNEWIAQSNIEDYTPIWDQGLHGEGQMVGLIDEEVDLDHCSFFDSVLPGPTHRKFHAFRASGSAHSHGTHVAGILAGDWGTNGMPDFRDGLAFAARISFSDFTPVAQNHSTFYDRLVDAHNDGARVHSNSWGESSRSYTLWSELADRFSRDYEESMVLVAADNGGLTKAPENAKNVLAVQRSNDTPNQHLMGSTVVTGPTLDLRRKPEICAPGESTNSSKVSTSCSWRTMSGTSMATPLVAAGGVLTRQYFSEGFYPTGIPVPGDALVPTGALLRACLINGAEDMTGEAGYPGDQEGWGRLLLDSTLYFAGDDRNLFVVDLRNNDGLATGESDSFTVESLDPAEPLRFTLVWTDVPATTGATEVPINDLDLTVIAPDDSIYLGNVFNTTLGESQTGGTADALNNVEQVHLLTPEVGFYEVRIGATEVNQELQGYALVVTGSLGDTGPAPRIESLSSCAVHDTAGEFCASFGPGILDPNDNIEPRRSGVTKLQIVVSEDIDLGTVGSSAVKVNCANAGAYTGAVTVDPPGGLEFPVGDPQPVQSGEVLRVAEALADVEAASNQLAIEFAPALPDQDCCEISLSGVATMTGVPIRDVRNIRTLAGDMTRDGQVTTADPLSIKLSFGQPIDASNFLLDFNESGAVTTGDYLQLGLYFGHSAPACP